MEVQLTDDQKAFIREALQSGRLAREEDAVREAMLLWEERERRRLEILSVVDTAETSLARRQGHTITSHAETSQISEDIKRRGRSRLQPPQEIA